MNNRTEVCIRLRERLRVYRDSPAVQTTYVDLAHLIEDILELIEGEQIGFKKGEE